MKNNTAIDNIRNFCEQEAKKILAEITGTLGVVVSTVDGFEVAYAHHGDLVPERIAAMASSISAIGSVVARESFLDDPSDITIYSGNGFVQVFLVNHSDENLLIVNIISDSTAIMAQVNHRGKRFAKALRELR
ncbi:roadblock/LC7 domain-containing protein [Rhodoferax aquaticus]|uniref:Roadblock/LC7 domain-containing protein n=1 Tax=Rhodoferax aquaticus TaxID=2527691 RepID=A0A515ES97_9BURK|nr:roadblock/LC7 domain-containing protein [Rhodoferax aquaticus]QDL55534.1 roadblock/LC7 domain-containing protein [Rhodoferax aquaticus]